MLRTNADMESRVAVVGDQHRRSSQSCAKKFGNLATLKYLNPFEAAQSDAFFSGIWTLVERFDIEPFPYFSAKGANFIGLVLFCIDAKFYKKIFVGKLLTRSTRFTCFCTAHTSIFQKNIVKFFRIFRQNFVIFEFFPVIFA